MAPELSAGRFLATAAARLDALLTAGESDGSIDPARATQLRTQCEDLLTGMAEILEAAGGDRQVYPPVHLTPQRR